MGRPATRVTVRRCRVRGPPGARLLSVTAENKVHVETVQSADFPKDAWMQGAKRKTCHLVLIRSYSLLHLYGVMQPEYFLSVLNLDKEVVVIK